MIEPEKSAPEASDCVSSIVWPGAAISRTELRRTYRPDPGDAEVGEVRLAVLRHDGSSREVALAQDSLVVGRRTDTFEPDLVLDDPDSLISRRHFVLDRQFGSWWLDDPGSHNGTFLRRRGELVRVTERTNIGDGDVICVAGTRADGDEPGYWELRLVDPSATATFAHRALSVDEFEVPITPHVSWDPQTYRLDVVTPDGRRSVELRKQGYLLIAHMAAANAAGDGFAVVCSVDDLMQAIWGPPDEWDRYRPPTPDNLRDLVSAVRREIEPDPGSPLILENLRGVGYRLNTSPRVSGED